MSDVCRGKNNSNRSRRLPSNGLRDSLILHASKQYYIENLTVKEIAAELGLNRWQVSKLLKEGLEKEIVNINFSPKLERNLHIEAAIQKKYKLQDAIVITCGNPQLELNVEENVMKAAADYLTNLKLDGQIFGVSWGRTIMKIAEYLPKNWAVNLNIVFINGSSVFQQTKGSGFAIADQFAKKGSDGIHHLPVPAILGSASTKYALEKDDSINRVLELGAKASTICFGLGGIEEKSVLVSSGYLSLENFNKLAQSGAVGDILGRFVDKRGKIVDENLNRRTLGIDLEKIKKKQRSIGVCTGSEKHKILQAALSAGYVNVIITDELSAKYALDTS